MRQEGGGPFPCLGGSGLEAGEESKENQSFAVNACIMRTNLIVIRSRQHNRIDVPAVVDIDAMGLLRS
jgi:hypothetical protein